MSPRLLAAMAAAGLVAASGASSASFASLQARAYGPTGLTYAEARTGMPGLKQVTFDKADRNGNGVVDGAEWNTLQSVYNALNRDR